MYHDMTHLKHGRIGTVSHSREGGALPRLLIRRKRVLTAPGPARPCKCLACSRSVAVVPGLVQRDLPFLRANPEPGLCQLSSLQEGPPHGVAVTWMRVSCWGRASPGVGGLAFLPVSLTSSALAQAALSAIPVPAALVRTCAEGWWCHQHSPRVP